MKNVRKIEMLQNKVDGFLIASALSLPAVANVLADEKKTDVFDVATTGFQDVYKKLLTISTPVCAVVIIASLLIAHLGGEKAVEKGRKAAIGTGITWAVINGLGLFFNFVAPYVNGYSNLW